MASLEKRSYDVYVQNLSIPKKKRLIEEIEKSINDEYMNWCDMMAEFLKDSKIDTRLFSVYYEFEGYTVSRRKAVIRYDDGRSCRAFYVTSPGEIETTEWDDMGFPHSEAIKIEGNAIHEWCKQHKIKDLEKVLTFFAETHPNLK